MTALVLPLRKSFGRVPAIQPASLSEAFSPHPLDGAGSGFVLALIGMGGPSDQRGLPRLGANASTAWGKSRASMASHASGVRPIAGGGNQPPGGRPVLWVQDGITGRETGIPCLAGTGLTLMRVEISRPADVLAAMEDALACPALGAVVGEIWGDPAALDFTATRRLATRADAAGIPCWLIRRAATPNPSAARQRWRVATLPSAGDPDDPSAPGDPRWRVELFRCRSGQTGEWVVDHDRKANRLHLSALSADREMAARPATAGQRAER